MEQQYQENPGTKSNAEIYDYHPWNSERSGHPERAHDAGEVADRKNIPRPYGRPQGRIPPRPVRVPAIDGRATSPAIRLHDRLPTAALPNELVDLAAAFNAMLSRLEDSFRRLSEFSSDLAHELRTPIANLMTQTQVALSRTRSAEEYREVLRQLQA